MIARLAGIAFVKRAECRCPPGRRHPPFWATYPCSENPQKREFEVPVSARRLTGTGKANPHIGTVGARNPRY
jgi:hypothetical protein